MMPTRAAPLESQNMLLTLLPEESRQALPPLEQVMLQSGMVLYEADEKIEHAYFPEDALVSIVSTNSDGHTVEIGMVGCDGMIGVPGLLGGKTPYRAVVQAAGLALRMKCGSLVEDEYKDNKAFQELLLKYANMFMVQVAQSSLCNCFHPLPERLSRWLMVAGDAARSNTLRITHDTIARLLGTRRASVTSTAGLLQRAGLIRLSRGQIVIVDPKGLEQTCCECYGILKESIRQLMS